MLSGCIEKEKEVFIRISYAQAWIQSMERSCVAPQILHQRIILKWSWLAGPQGLSRSEHKFYLSREASKYCPSKVPLNTKGNEPPSPGDSRHHSEQSQKPKDRKY